MNEINVRNKRKKWFISVVIIVLVTIGLGVYRYSDFNKMIYVNKSDLEIIVEKVSMLAELPKNEKPTIATVSDLSILQNQPFFSKAKIGDKVLIFTKTKKVILYRPEKNIIIDMTPINMQIDN